MDKSLAEGVLAGFGLGVIIFYILTVIAGWKIFEKAGEKGWKSLIPIYNLYLFYKIVGMKKWFWWSLIIVPAVCGAITSLNGLDSSMTEEEIKALDLSQHIPALCAIAVQAIVAFVADVIYAKNTSKAFGKGTGFAILTFFFPNIAWLILGFGKAEYDKKFLKD